MWRCAASFYLIHLPLLRCLRCLLLYNHRKPEPLARLLPSLLVTSISPVSPVSKLFEIWQSSWQDTRFFSAKTSIKRGGDLVMCKMGPTTITKPLQKGVFEGLLGSNIPLLTKFSVVKFWVARDERKFHWKPRQLQRLPAAVFFILNCIF